MRAPRYLVCLFFITCYQALRVIVAAVLRVKDVPGGVYDDVPRAWGRSLLQTQGIPYRAEGLDRLGPGPFVYASNHFSFVDIWALVAVIPDSVRFVSKKELSYVPLFGQAMRMSGHIFIDRQNLTSAFDAYKVAARQIRSGKSAIVFPEGTRSRDGTLQAFKKGPFVLAIAAGVPVVPVYVGGTYDVLPPGSSTPRPRPITVRFGDPIPTGGLTYDDRDTLSRRCRDAIVQLAAGVDAVSVGG